MQLTWSDIEQHVADCTCCPLCRTRNRPVMGRGNHEAALMLIAEAPGGQKANRGFRLSGDQGKY